MKHVNFILFDGFETRKLLNDTTFIAAIKYQCHEDKDSNPFERP